MAVDLADYVDSLRREVSPPSAEITGGYYFSDATDDQLVGELSDAFWEARLDGLLEGFTESEGLISPVSGTTDITRDLIQLVVFYAGFRVLRAAVRNLNTVFRAKAGPVEYETQQSATVLKALFDELKNRRDILLTRLSDIGDIPTGYIDAVTGRADAIGYGISWWTRGTSPVGSW